MINLQSVSSGFNYWRAVFFNKFMTLFKYNNLPFDYYTLETYLAEGGYCGIIPTKRKIGGVEIPPIYPVKGSKTGILINPYDRKDFIYAHPTLGHKTVRCDKIVIAKNTSIYTQSMPLILRYAQWAAELDSTLATMLIDNRLGDYPTASTPVVAESVKEVYKKAARGETGVIIDTGMLGSFKLNVRKHNEDNINKLIAARAEIINEFYESIGIQSVTSKRERLVEAEAESNSQRLLLNVRDMLECRKKMCEDIGRVYGIKCSVSLSPEYRFLEEHVNAYEDKESEKTENDS